MIETARLLLRPILLGDLHAAFSYRSDKSANKYQGWIPENLQEMEDFISKNPKSFNQPNTWFQLVLIDKKTEQLVGDIGIHFIGEENRQVDIGCTINAKYQGKGLATEAMSGCIKHLFQLLGKPRIMASLDPRNIPSIKLVERLGFRKEAHFKQNLLINGQWVDDVVYALLRSEWKELVAYP